MQSRYTNKIGIQYVCWFYSLGICLPFLPSFLLLHIFHDHRCRPKYPVNQNIIILILLNMQYSKFCRIYVSSLLQILNTILNVHLQFNFSLSCGNKKTIRAFLQSQTGLGVLSNTSDTNIWTLSKTAHCVLLSIAVTYAFPYGYRVISSIREAVELQRIYPCRSTKDSPKFKIQGHIQPYRLPGYTWEQFAETLWQFMKSAAK